MLAEAAFRYSMSMNAKLKRVNRCIFFKKIHAYQTVRDHLIEGENADSCYYFQTK